MADSLSDDAVAAKLPEEWARDGDEIVRVFEFDDYLTGVAFASEIGEISEEQFHHPEITIRYEEIEVRFTTHDAGGITDKDIDMAVRCNDLD